MSGPRAWCVDEGRGRLWLYQYKQHASDKAAALDRLGIESITEGLVSETEVAKLRTENADLRARLAVLRTKRRYDLKRTTQTVYDSEAEAALDLRNKYWRKARGSGR